MTGLEAFDSTFQKTNLWLREIMEGIGTDDKHKAYLALRAVLQTLRDHLLVQEAAELGAQLPVLIRGLYYEGWRPSDMPEKGRSKDEFLNRIVTFFPNDPEVDAEKVVKAVLLTMAHHVTPGEMRDVKQLLPHHIRELWPQEAPV
jgi:uncharacterized protein (DUF2267 family)